VVWGSKYVFFICLVEPVEAKKFPMFPGRCLKRDELAMAEGAADVEMWSILVPLKMTARFDTVVLVLTTPETICPSPSGVTDATPGPGGVPIVTMLCICLINRDGCGLGVMLC
jgi:hypothetical protein